MQLLTLTTKKTLTRSPSSDGPSRAGPPQNRLAHPHFSLLSQTTTEQFAPSQATGHLPYGDLHTPAPAATEPMGFCVIPNPGPRLGSSLIQNNVPVSVQQSQNQYQNQMPHGLHCGWSRDLEPHPVPPSIPGIPLPHPTLQVPHSYSSANQDDAWMWHVLGGGADTCASSPGVDTGLSASGFLSTFADDDFPSDVCADPQLSIAPVHNIMPPAQSQSQSQSQFQSGAFPSNEQICQSDRPTHTQTRSFECRWLVQNGAPCGLFVTADRRSVHEHLQHVHGIKPGEEKARETCFWEHCRTVLKKESLARHILTVHVKDKVCCDDCGLLFAREDSLKRHLRGGQHNVSPGKSAARQPPSRDHAGLPR